MYNQYYDDYNYIRPDNVNLDECYPEIYKIVYPMVMKSCEKITAPITKEKINRMAEEVYSKIEVTEEPNRDIPDDPKNMYKKTYESLKKEIRSNIEDNREIKETRKFNKPLSDLIKILLIRELKGNSFWGDNRPPFGPPPPPPGRPPFGPPPPPPGRPPFGPGAYSPYDYGY